MPTPILVLLMIVSLAISIDIDVWWIEIITGSLAGGLAILVGERIDDARPVKAGER